MKSQYRTHQRDELIDAMQRIPAGHFTVQDLYAYLKQNGSAIGTTTVYRQLEKMVDEGIVNKYLIDGTSPACFEYAGDRHHADDEVCFHLKCEKCGVLIHMHCDELKEIAGHLKEEHHFTLNPLRTVFYGLCESCASRDRKE